MEFTSIQVARAHLRGPVAPSKYSSTRPHLLPHMQGQNVKIKMADQTVSSDQKSHKTCFVTIGATASFTGLIKAVLSEDFLKTLEAQDYTHLLVQYGQDGKELYDECLSQLNSEASTLQISGFDLDPSGLRPYMLQAKGHHNLLATEGVVISHAGSGTILDALRVGIPLIVVPNESLLDNHQVELAEALAELEYVVYGKLGDVSSAMDEAEQLRVRMKTWPPPNSGVHRQAKGLKGVMDEEMGFLD